MGSFDQAARLHGRPGRSAKTYLRAPILLIGFVTSRRRVSANETETLLAADDVANPLLKLVLTLLMILALDEAATAAAAKTPLASLASHRGIGKPLKLHWRWASCRIRPLDHDDEEDILAALPPLLGRNQAGPRPFGLGQWVNGRGRRSFVRCLAHLNLHPRHLCSVLSWSTDNT